MRKIIEELACKHEASQKPEKLKILTLLVDKFSYDELLDFGFTLSWRQFENATKLRENKGVMALPDAKPSAKKLPPEVQKRIISFYSDESNGHIRFLPGKKDFISMENGEYAQKRLILCTLKELYQYYRETFPSDKIGFSTFCSLRPKYSIFAGSYGTHSVCVCTKHQNTKLLLHAAKVDIKYYIIINDIVCNPENQECLMRLCKKCTNIEYMERILLKHLKWNQEQIDKNKNIQYKEWSEGTDRAELLTKNCNLKDLILKLICDRVLAL